MIETVYAYTDGEKILSTTDGDRVIPMVYTERRMALLMIPMIESFARQAGKDVFLVAWSPPQVVKTIRRVTVSEEADRA